MDIVEWSHAGVQRHPWELARFEVLSELFTTAVPLGTAEKLVVDMGCGDCWFAHQLLERRKDIRIIGVDPAYSEKDIMQRLPSMPDRFHLVRHFEEAVSLAEGKEAAAILLFDVIEHIENDGRFLQELARARFFSPTTSLLVSVPAFASLFTKHDVFLKHYRRYNPRSLKQVITAAGLVPQQTAYFFTSLLPLRWWEKQKEKAGRTSRQEGIGNWKGSRMATRLFSGALMLDYRLSKLLARAGLRLPGLSLYCQCKKPA